MKASDVARRLAGQADAICRLLLPGGKVTGNEYECGSISGGPGKSLRVHLGGTKAGLWKDFSSDSPGGDLLDLWCKVRGVTLPGGILQAMDYLGIERKPPPRSYSVPKMRDPVPVSTEVERWFADRGIERATVDLFRVSEPSPGVVLFPYYLPDGTLAHIKFRKLPKRFHSSADTRPSLFGWHALVPGSRQVVIVEGEPDAMVVRQMGFSALSVPIGGGDGSKQQWIEYEFDALSAFDDIVLWMDQDPVGKSASKAIAQRLGRGRVRVLSCEHKDANDALRAGAGPEQFGAWIDAASFIDPDNLVGVASLRSAIRDEFTPGRIEEGVRLPFPKAKDLVIFRPGELSVWAGYNGHGKTEMIDQVMIAATAQGFPAAAASLEFTSRKFLKRLVRQVAATATPAEHEIESALGFLEPNLWIFDPPSKIGDAKPAAILETFEYLATRRGVRFFVVDNLAKCGFADDDYAGQKHFVDRLTDFAKDTDTHVALVVHMRKGEVEEKPGGKFDIKGSGGITDLADTVMLVWRNKLKEKEIRAGKSPQSLLETCDAMLQCVKQRNGEDEPAFLLWYDKVAHHFLESPFSKPRAWV